MERQNWREENCKVGQGQGEVMVLWLIYTVVFWGFVCDTCLENL